MSRDPRPQGSRPKLRFKTALFDLGNYRSFIYNKETHRELLLGISNKSFLESFGDPSDSHNAELGPQSYVCHAISSSRFRRYR